MDLDEIYQREEENYFNLVAGEEYEMEQDDYFDIDLNGEIYEREEENYLKLMENEDNEIQNESCLDLLENKENETEENDCLNLLENKENEVEEDDILNLLEKENEVEEDDILDLLEKKENEVEEDDIFKILECKGSEGEDDKYLLERNILLRNYQLKLLEFAKKQNSIIYLPTGAGKTLIAIHVLCSRTLEINRPFCEGGKRAFFLTPTKVLVHQQARVLRTHTKFKVMGVTGDLNVDSWSGAKWKVLFEKMHVFVMTAEILKVILQLNFISPTRISFLVLDECHHAVYDHPYKLVLEAVNSSTGEAPLILGLTSVLFNNTPKASQVEQIVKDLEGVMNGKVVTESQMQEVLSFSTNPTDKLVTYNNKDSALSENIMMMYDRLIQVLDSLYISPLNAEEIPDGGKDYKSHNRARRLKNSIVTSRSIFDSLGFFGGSMSVLFYIIVFEKLRLLSTNPVEIQALVYARTELVKMRLFFQRCMGEEETVQSIVEFSSDKVQKLIRCLREVHEARKGRHIGIIVFVKQRAMAVVLAFVLKRLSAVGSEYSFLKPEFIIGTSTFYNGTLLPSSKNDEIVEKFTARTLNVLVATNLLEEGVDLSACNAVICFDFPTGYPSYFQSRGRARDKDGVFMMFTEELEVEKKKRSLDFFRNIEQKVMKALSQRLESVEYNEELESEEALEKLSLPGKSGPVLVDGIMAITAVQRYCSKLPQDKYTFLSPTSWFTIKDGLKKGFVRLPINCPLRAVIEGEEKVSRRLARRSAFLNTVKKLFEMGELNEELNPRSRELSVEEYGYLFPQFKNEKVDKALPQPGTSKRRQKYRTKFAECLSDCLPRPGTKAYLHVIIFNVTFEKPPLERKVVIYETLKLPATFALLSSKRLHKVLQFPIFMDMGKIQCNLLVNYDELVLTEAEIDAIKECHFTLFKKISRTCKNSQVFDNRNKEHSFFVVPVDMNEENRFVLDWNLIRNDYCKISTSALMRYNPRKGVERWNTPAEQSVESNALLPVDAINGRVLWGYDQAEGADQPKFMMTENDYRYFVIFPNYRNQDFPQRYIVNKFCHDMSPLSPFPKPQFKDYVAYYKNTYAADITNVNQPLLRVSPIFNCLNFNKPRRRMLERKQMKHYEEHLVPELCDVIPFDRRFYLKALLLPTVLNRIYHVCFVEEFRRRLVAEVGIGTQDLPEGADWTPLDLRMDVDAEENDASFAATELALPLSKLMDHTQKSQKVLDSERHLYEVGLCDLEFFVGILKESSAESGREKKFKENDHLIKLSASQKVPVPRLKTLANITSAFGPDLGHLIQAVTSKGSNDCINYERLEILGDSLLKFAASLFLFRNFTANEGVLTTLKGKIVGNRNLLYCALAKNIPDVINVTDFAPLSDWNPPLMSIPDSLLDDIVREDVDPAVIYRFEIPLEEQFSGVLSATTLQKNQDLLRDFSKSYELVTNSLLPYKVISDKTISDCSEALIGVYLLNSGLRGALDFLIWLQVLPENTATYSELIEKPLSHPNIPEEHVLLFLQEIFYGDLEDTLNYRFRNKALLLEAVTHPSYSKNRLTDCYQRLEFLGDAVLDFLVTSYIYEYCGNLTPGQVTDIRSSLVNNITFACLTVRYELHKYLLSFSSTLITTINKFVAFQANRNHVVDENVMILAEDEYSLAETVQVPKALGDIFEALAGAIYLDSGNSLETVWRVFYALMKQELDEFTKCVPKTPVRLLCEICCDKPYFESKVLDNNTVMVSCVVYYDNEEIKAYGFGGNKKDAKKSACKMALNKILSSKK